MSTYVPTLEAELFDLLEARTDAKQKGSGQGHEDYLASCVEGLLSFIDLQTSTRVSEPNVLRINGVKITITKDDSRA